jgi:hypothetical protein
LVETKIIPKEVKEDIKVISNEVKPVKNTIVKKLFKK